MCWYDLTLPECLILDEVLPRGSGSLELDVRVMCRSQSQLNAQPYEQGRIAASVPYRIEGTIDQVLPPVRDPAIDALVSAMSVRSGNGSWGFSNALTRTPRTERMAFGVLIDYCLDGVPQSVQRMWWIGGSPSSRRSLRSFDSEWIDDPRVIPAISVAPSTKPSPARTGPCASAPIPRPRCA